MHLLYFLYSKAKNDNNNENDVSEISDTLMAVQPLQVKTIFQIIIYLNY